MWLLETLAPEHSDPVHQLTLQSGTLARGRGWGQLGQVEQEPGEDEGWVLGRGQGGGGGWGHRGHPHLGRCGGPWGGHGVLLLGPRAGEAADPCGPGGGEPGPGGGARARLRRVEILVDVEGVSVGGGRGEGGVRLLVLVVQVEVELLEGLVHDAPGLGLAALVSLGPGEAGQGQQEAGGGHGAAGGDHAATAAWSPGQLPLLRPALSWYLPSTLQCLYL